MKAIPFITRMCLLSALLSPVLNKAYAQCGTMPAAGTTAINTTNAIVNSYYPGLGNPAPGATSITVGARDTRGGAAFANGDLILIIQMQGADFNTSNNDSYGDGVTGGDASGYLTGNLAAGRYEYNTVAGFNTGTGVITLGNSLGGYYYTRAYSATTGIRAYQVIKVARYYNLSVTTGNSITAPAWNGSTGGIVVIEAANQLTLNGSINANFLGFRGGGGKRFAGIGGSSSNGTGTLTRTDYRWNSAVTTADNSTGGAKGEGIAGTPRYIFTRGTTNATTSGVEGYVNGSMGRGAPGNAGGGGTDGDPAANQYNPGGGGGGNAGAGGNGGSGWDGGPGNAATYPTGGYGGGAFTQGSVTRFVLGGGGGAGTNNNSTAGTTDYLSSGATGGGIVIVRARTFSGNGSVTANGAPALDVTTAGVTDAAGGGGAGGSILVLTNTSGAAGTHTITASAIGGKGGNMETHYAHGPGGGGGGGLVVTNVIPSGSVTVTGGANGLTRVTSASGDLIDPYNATAGAAGRVSLVSNNVQMANGANPSSPCGVLPVTLNQWNGVFNNNKTSLNWQTDKGADFSHFVVEHSTNGTHYTTLAQVQASTANTATLQYTYTDAAPASGINYYRLKMVDVNGQFKYSGIITIRTDVKGFRATATPNPFTDHIVLTIESTISEAAHIRVFNADGKLVWRKTVAVTAGSNAQYFNELQQLPKGMYFIKVNQQQSAAELKLIKQ